MNESLPSKDSNLILIGMPGAGKSTVGVLLAKETAKDFVDTDILIQNSQNKSLQQIIDEHSYLELRQVEETVLLNLHMANAIISTGGSAVYSSAAMNHLKQLGTIIFLDVPLDELKRRIGDFSQRGVAKQQGQTFEQLFEERSALYNQYADIRIPCSGKSQQQVCSDIICALD